MTEILSTVPTYDELMLPVLQAVKMNGGRATIDEIAKTVIASLQISADILALPVSKKRPDSKLLNRLGWARTYLKKAGFLENPSKGIWEITTAGELTDTFDAKALTASIGKEGRALKKARKTDLEGLFELGKELRDTSLAARAIINEQHRQAVLARFPVGTWDTITLEDYAMGLNDEKNSYSYWMEFRTADIFGGRGGFASKHFLSFSKKKNAWMLPRGFENEQDAFKALKTEMQRVLALAENDRWEEMDSFIPPQLLSKTLFIYFPKEVLPIGSRRHLERFLLLFGVSQKEIRKMGPIQCHRKLLKILGGFEELEGLNTAEFAHLLYQWNDPRDIKKVMRVTPGEGGSLWKSWMEDRYCSVGWDKVGDMREFQNKTALRESIMQHYEKTKGELSKLTADLWEFSQLEVGDWVVANKGFSEVLAAGQVSEIYSFDENRQEHQHVVKVNWDTDFAKKISSKNSWCRTISRKIPFDVQREIFRKGGTVVRPSSEAFEELERALSMKKQVILYGPPGTGKTYTARRFAMWWTYQDDTEKLADALSSPESFLELERNQSQGDDFSLVTRVTFHPSYSYEDFVEGFRPQETSDGTLSLKLENGIFKRICQEAKDHPDQRYLLIIDELNRGNISKILGELITLLEANKRGMMITLPQSKEQFWVPENVYILGTMNTADRSLRHLDVALRRRFQFIEYMPDAEKLADCVVGNIGLDDFLSELNKRITKYFDREKQLGHAFLMKDGTGIRDEEDLVLRLRYEIIPLIQEYALGDYRTLEKILGKSIVDGDTLNEDTLSDGNALLSAIAEHFPT